MSFDNNINPSTQQNTTSQLFKTTGDKTTSHTKAWAVVAIAVGILILGVAAFGVAGLLHTHGLMGLPQWLASAVGTVGGIAPYNMGLWAMTGGGGLLGSALTIGGIGGSVKLVKTPQNKKSSSGLNSLHYNNKNGINDINLNENDNESSDDEDSDDEDSDNLNKDTTNIVSNNNNIIRNSLTIKKNKTTLSDKELRELKFTTNEETLKVDKQDFHSEVPEGYYFHSRVTKNGESLDAEIIILRRSKCEFYYYRSTVADIELVAKFLSNSGYESWSPPIVK